ncbi:DUF1565 domain-containing protein [Leptolyngbyaceae cyanobacterium UHCC 1019]
MRLITAPIFSLSYFFQTRILHCVVQLLSGSLGAIAISQTGSTQAIDFSKVNNPNPQQVFTQRSTLLAQPTVAQSSTSILYVNSSEGSDTENGSDLAPLKTITHALKTAQSGTTILLAPGTYSVETGETFPLVLKAGVTLQGDPATRGQEILIRGGGISTRKVWTQQSLTIEITSSATINGVTVTNPNPQGYGVGIDASNPVITNSTFTENSYGMAIAGDSNARIQNNYFYQNRSAGIGVAGIAQPNIQDNIFEQNGSAVLVSDRAAPLIANNRMTQNQDGMIFQGSAQPVVRNNSVEGNRQHGLIAKEMARPDLGTPANPGENFFRNNGLADVNVKATEQVISAVGNEWANTIGTLNTTVSMASSSNLAATFPIPSALSANPSSEPPRPMQIVQLAMPSNPSQQATSLQSSNSIQRPFNLQPSPQSLSITPTVKRSPLVPPLISPSLILPPVSTLAIAPPAQSSAKRQNLSAIARPLPLSVVPQIPTAPPLETFPLPPLSSTLSARPNTLAKLSALPTQKNQLLLLSSVPAIPIAIAVPSPETPVAAMPVAIPVPPPETITLRSNLEKKPVRSIKTRSIQVMIETPKVTKNNSTSLLPVPSPNIPVGRIGGMPSVYSMRGGIQPSLLQNTTVFSNNPKVSAVRFRVVVPQQEMEQAQMLALVPDAFLVTSNNQVMMQVGAFSDRTKAEQLARTLASQGISSTIEPINP